MKRKSHQLVVQNQPGLFSSRKEKKTRKNIKEQHEQRKRKSHQVVDQPQPGKISLREKKKARKKKKKLDQVYCA